MIQKFNVGFCTFSYGGNGGISSEVPDIREWMTPLVSSVSRDPRVENVRLWNLSDTPITMTRNRAVIMAREFGIDVLVMVDSDMKPDLYAGTDGSQPFFQSSFDFIVNHYPKGPVCIGAPYCGPPPHECVYVFRWQNMRSNNVNPDFQLEMYDRHTAAKLTGIQECAALPTGLIMYDMRCFDLTEPKTEADKPWFYYEWKNKYATEKASTEDVTQTRDLSLVGTQKLGYNPVFCNWDAWAGHWKPLCVGKPVHIDASGVASKLIGDWHQEPDVKLCDLRPSSRFLEKLAGYAPLTDGSPEKAADLRRLMDLAPEGPFLEVGNREGGSLLMAMSHPRSTAVVGVDPYDGKPYRVLGGAMTTEYDDAMYLRMMQAVKSSPAAGKLQHYRMTSQEFISKASDAKYSFVYLDGVHDAGTVGMEVEFFGRHLLPGGVIVVDDVQMLPSGFLAGWTMVGDMAYWVGDNPPLGRP